MSQSKTDRKKGFARKDWVRLALIVLAVGGGVFLSWAANKTGQTQTAYDQATVAAVAGPDTGWTVGEPRKDGLRTIPSGRSDASAVLDPSQFEDKKVKNAYWIATQIPGVLNQLYCWCGCENRGQHRSDLQCFEDMMGVDCDVCQGTAEIAYEMVQRGVTDAAKVQGAVDAKRAAPGA